MKRNRLTRLIINISTLVNIIIQIKLYQETAIKIFKSGNTKRVMFKFMGTTLSALQSLFPNTFYSHTFYSAWIGCPCMATHRRSSPPGTHVSGPTTSGKFFDCWIEQFCKVGLIAIDWEIFHLIAWSIFCTLVLLVHKLQGKKTALGSKLPHILAQRLPQGALQSLFIDHSYDITLEESVNVTFTNANYKCKVEILEFLGGRGPWFSIIILKLWFPQLN